MYSQIIANVFVYANRRIIKFMYLVNCPSNYAYSLENTIKFEKICDSSKDCLEELTFMYTVNLA